MLSSARSSAGRSTMCVSETVVVFLVVTVWLHGVASSPCYFVTAPKMFPVDADETVVVMATGLTDPATVWLHLEVPNSAYRFGNKTIHISNNELEAVSVKVPQSVLGTPNPQGQHDVILVSTSSIAGQHMRREARVLVGPSSENVFIQTDKPIYSPGENVSIRVFTTDKNTNARRIPVTVEVKDPQGVVLFHEESETESGVLEYSYQLPQTAMTGNWAIVTRHGLNTSTLPAKTRHEKRTEVEVKEYALPSFGVFIEVFNSYILNSTETIRGKVRARYSFGQLVKGNARVELRVVKVADAMGDDLVYVTHEWVELVEGEASFSISIEDIKEYGELFRFPQVLGSSVQVQATVIEQASGATGRATYRGCPFVRSPYGVDVSRTPAYFHPGFELEIHVDVRDVRDLPVGGVPVLFILTGVLKNGETVPLRTPSPSQPLKTDLYDGSLSVTTQDTWSNLTSITVRVATADPKFEHQQASASIVIQTSQSRDHMVIRAPIARTQNVGEKVSFEVLFDQTSVVPPVLFFLVVARGSILHQGVHSSTSGRQYVTLLLNVTERMAPSARLVVWYSTGSDVTANSRVFDVNNTCGVNALSQVEVMARGKPRASFHPGANVELTLRGSPGSRVSLAAVDSAVHFLKQQRDVTLDKLFGQLGDLDLGSGPGDGADAGDVFKKSGLVVTRSGIFQTPAHKNGPQSHKESEDGGVDNHVRCCSEGDLLGKNLGELSAQIKNKRCRLNAVTSGGSPTCVNEYYRCCTSYIKQKRGDTEASRSSKTYEEEDVTLIERSSGKLYWNFPESWLFQTVRISNTTGVATVALTLPHSITTWVLSAVATSPLGGMCIAAPTKVKVDQKLFVRLDVPKDAVLGEQLDIQATVFNMYKGSPKEMYISLRCTPNICVPRTHNTTKWCNQKVITVTNFRAVTWPVVPLTAGRFPITIRLRCINGQYNTQVMKYITIRHGGIQMKRSLSVLLSPATLKLLPGSLDQTITTMNWNATTRKQSIDLDLQLPPEVIPGSLTGTITITGDAMEPLVTAMRTKETSVGFSSAYGPEVLADLAKTLAVARYLEGLHQMTPDLRKQIALALSRGIGEILQFRKPDGGFALWKTERSKLWLTARTVEVLAQIARLNLSNILSTNPAKTTRHGADWLLKQQHCDGHFQLTAEDGAPGQDAHLNAIAATSGALNALTEFGRKSIRRAAIKARNYLVHNINNVTSVYHLAMMSYSLTLARDSHSHQTFSLLKSKAHCITHNISAAGVRTCSWPVEVNTHDWDPGYEQDFWHRHGPSHVELETSGYALLTHLLRSDDDVFMQSVTSWLMHQRHRALGLGDLKGLVVSVQALTSYSLRHLNQPVNTNVVLRTGVAKQQLSASSFDDVSRMSARTYDISKVQDSALSVEASGRGVGFVQVDMTYHVYATTSNPNYNISVNASKSNMFRFAMLGIIARSHEGRFSALHDETIDFEVCLHRMKGAGNEGRLVLDVGLHTGYRPVEDSLKQTNSDFYEHHYTTTRSVTFFLKQVATSDRVCLKFKVLKTAKVRNVKHSSVKLHSATGEKLCETFYLSEEVAEPGGMTHEVSDRCLNDVNQCPTCYHLGIGETLPPHIDDLETMACSYKFVFIIDVLDQTFGEIVQTRARIWRLFKLDGRDSSLIEGFERTFESNIDCKCPVFSKGKYYLVYGNTQKGNSYSGYTYVIDRSAFVLERPPAFDKSSLAKSLRKFMTRKILGQIVTLC